MDQILLDTIISRIQAVPSVEAVMLSGSRTAGSLDAHSDTDLYVYWSEAVDAEVRRELAGEFASAMEIDNRFWEPEDLWILKDEQASAHEPGAKPEKVELIYRDYDFLRRASWSESTGDAKHGSVIPPASPPTGTLPRSSSTATAVSHPSGRSFPMNTRRIWCRIS
jgi:predicted nucleotidyltransferase